MQKEIDFQSKIRHEAQILPKSVNLDDRTIDVEWLTFQELTHYTWEGDRYIEIYSKNAENIDLGFLNSGIAGFFNQHNNSAESQLGIIIENSTRMKSGKMVSTVKFADENALTESQNALVNKILSGITRAISATIERLEYTFEKAEKSEVDKGFLGTLHTSKWRPLEISTVGIGRDPGAATNSADNKTRSTKMGKKKSTEKVDIKEQKEKTPDVIEKEIKNSKPEEKPEESKLDIDEIVKNAREQGRKEQKRFDAKVIQTCQATGLDESDVTVREIVKNCSTPDQVVSALLKHKVENDTNTPTTAHADISISRDEKHTDALGISDALLFDSRIYNESDIKNFGNAKRFVNMNAQALMGYCLSHNGIDVMSMSPADMADRVFSIANNAMSTSDFPYILADALGKSAKKGYKAKESLWQKFYTRSDFKDFKSAKSVQISEAPTPVLLKEGGEITYGSLSEGYETYSLLTYAKGLMVTRETLINDDLNIIMRGIMKLGAGATRLEANLAWSMITANANMSDGHALCSGSHNNQSASAAAPSISTIQAGIIKMQQQLDIGGIENIDIMPKYILVPLEYQLSVNQILAKQFNPTSSADAPTSDILGLEYIAENRLSSASATDWYLVADPNDVEGFVWGHLKGKSGLFTETERQFGTGQMRVIVRDDVGFGVTDYRNIYKNTTP